MTRYDYDAWFVYELIDPRSRSVFYIGKSATPNARLSDHKRNPASAAYDRIQDIRAAGLEVEMYKIAQFNTEAEAFEYEGYLITKTPGLVNRQGYYAPEAPFRRPVLEMQGLTYVTTENQPVPDETNIADAIAVALPYLERKTILAVLRAKAALFDVEFEYVGVTDE